MKRALPQREGTNRSKNGASESKPQATSPPAVVAVEQQQQQQRSQAEARRLRRRVDSDLEKHPKASKEEKEGEAEEEEKEAEEIKNAIDKEHKKGGTEDLSSKFVARREHSCGADSLHELRGVIAKLTAAAESAELRAEVQDKRLVELEQQLAKQQQLHEEALASLAARHNSEVTQQIEHFGRSLQMLEKTMNAQRESMIRQQMEHIESLQSQITSLTATQDRALREEHERVQLMYSRLFQLDQNVKKLHLGAVRGGFSTAMEAKNEEVGEISLDLPKDASEADYGRVWKACEQGNLTAITAMLGNVMIDVNYSFEEEHRWTLLHCVAWNGHAAITRILVDLGANPNAVSKDQNTPLHYAASQGHAEVVKLLLDGGANIHAADIDQRTPLHCAALRDRVSVVQILLDRGASPRAKNRDGKTPLDFCASWHPKVAALLRARIISTGGSKGDFKMDQERDSGEDFPL